MIKYKLICLVSFFILIYGCQKNDHKSKLFKFRKFNLLISDCKIERYEPSLQTD